MEKVGQDREGNWQAWLNQNVCIWVSLVDRHWRRNDLWIAVFVFSKCQSLPSLKEIDYSQSKTHSTYLLCSAILHVGGWEEYIATIFNLVSSITPCDLASVGIGMSYLLTSEACCPGPTRLTEARENGFKFLLKSEEKNPKFLGQRKRFPI
jgi:hypothetical protein